MRSVQLSDGTHINVFPDIGQSHNAKRVCERRVACEAAVEDKGAGEIVEDEYRQECLMNLL